MGGLIQTKGTQRLAKLFNTRFANLAATLDWRDAGGHLIADVFRTTPKLLDISDSFIAQFADPAHWPADLNDLLYPSATLKVDTIISNAQFTFKLPAGIPAAIAQDSAVCCLNSVKAIPKKTKVLNAPTLAGNVLTVTLSKNAPKLKVGDQVSFAQGKHERLVRRWRWYLEKDLRPENNDAIRQAISAALDNDDYKKVCFQTVEDTQRVIATPQSALDNSDELSDDMEMHILLLTQSTTSPDKLDPQ